LTSDNPPLYALEGKHAYYTREQLIKVDESNLPPDTLQDRFIVEKILGKKIINKKLYYLVKFKGYEKPEYTSASKLKDDVPKLVKEFNNKKFIR
jgi:hypothetical protein